MIFLRLRAARQDQPRRRVCQTYALTIGAAQVGWVALLLAGTTVGVFVAWVVVLILIEWRARKSHLAVARAASHPRMLRLGSSNRNPSATFHRYLPWKAVRAS
jgi:hypothetical protein